MATASTPVRWRRPSLAETDASDFRFGIFNLYYFEGVCLHWKPSRQLLFLGGVIMMLAIFPVPLRAGNLFHGVSEVNAAEREGKPRSPQLLECITIAHNTPYIESFGVAFDICGFLGGQNPLEKDSNWDSRSWEKCSVWVVSQKRCRQFSTDWQNAHRIAVTNFESNRLPVIFDIETYADDVVDFVPPIQNVFWCDRDIGSQLPLRRIISAPYQSDGGSPEKPSGGPKDYREDSNDAFRVYPIVRLAPTESRPFLPVFGIGALFMVVSAFSGNYIYGRGKRKWSRRLLKGFGAFLVGLGIFSFVFAWPWAAFF